MGRQDNHGDEALQGRRDGDCGSPGGSRRPSHGDESARVPGSGVRRREPPVELDLEEAIRWLPLQQVLELARVRDGSRHAAERAEQALRAATPTVPSGPHQIGYRSTIAVQPTVKRPFIGVWHAAPRKAQSRQPWWTAWRLLKQTLSWVYAIEIRIVWPCWRVSTATKRWRP